MMKLFRLGLAVAIVLASGAVASAASADDWKSNAPAGGLPFRGDAAGGSRLLIHGTGGDVALNCTTAAGTGTLAQSPPAGTNPWFAAATITPLFGAATGSGSCTVGGTPFTVSCAAADLDTGLAPGAYSGGSTLATADLGVTQGTLSNVSCTLRIGATDCSTVTGSVEGQYTNPDQSLSTDGKLTVFGGATQNLTAARIGTGCAAIPDGAASFGSQSNPPGDLSFDVTDPAHPANEPYVWYGT
jgi:hypothetical protein